MLKKAREYRFFYRYVFGICVPQMASQQMQREAVRILDILLSVVL